MTKEITCIICPRGCRLRAIINGKKVEISNNACKRGEAYGIDECIDPKRSVTSVLRISNRSDTMVSVKTSSPIAKEKIFEAMEIIRNKQVTAPVEIGDVLIEDVFGANIVATMSVK